MLPVSHARLLRRWEEANSWRDKPSKYKKDYDPDFVAYDGPLGFRDKSPKWIDQIILDRKNDSGSTST